MDKQNSNFNEDCELFFEAPLDIVNLYGLINSAKKTKQDVNFRKSSIKDTEDNIFSQLLESIHDGKINFFTLGDVMIKNDLDLKNFGVYISGAQNPQSHQWFRKNYYRSYVLVSEKTKDAIANAFDRVEKALDFVSASNFSAELSYYTNVGHFPIGFCENVIPENTIKNIDYLITAINNLSEKNQKEYFKIFSLLRLAQISNSPFESYSLTWNAIDIACNLCNKLFSLNRKQNDDIDILEEFKKNKPQNIDEARKLLRNLETNNIEDRWERAIKHNFKDFPTQANTIIEKCFYRFPEKIRLYNIRNQIAHGSINKDRRNIWQVSYRLAELNEFASHFALLAPLNKNILNRKNNQHSNDDEKIRMFGYLLDENGLPPSRQPEILMTIKTEKNKI